MATGFTQAMLDGLEAAIASGSVSVAYEGKSVTYRSLDDMLRLRTIIRNALDPDSGRSATILTQHSRG